MASDSRSMVATRRRNLLNEVLTAIRYNPDHLYVVLDRCDLDDRKAILGIDDWFTTQSDDLPLHVAIRNGRYDVVQQLICVYNVAVDQDGENSSEMRKIEMRWETTTPLLLAYHCRQFKIFELLLSLGSHAYVNQEFTNGRTLLNMACFDGSHNFVRILLRYGADVHGSRFYSGSNSLVSLVKGWGSNMSDNELHTRLAIMDDLLKSGAQIDFTESGQRTLVHVAAESNSAGCLITLIEKGAPAFSIDEKGLTPAMLAACLGHQAVVDVLSSQSDSPVTDKVASFELLGAVLVLRETTYQQGCRYMSDAMLLREAYGIEKQLEEGPIDDFYSERECSTAQELEQISNDRLRMSVESSFVFQRTLGTDHDLTIKHTSAVFKILSSTQDNLLAVKHVLHTAEQQRSVLWLGSTLEMVYHWCNIAPNLPERPVGTVLRKILMLLRTRENDAETLDNWKRQIGKELKWVIAFAVLIIDSFPGGEEYDLLCRLVEEICLENVRDVSGRSLLHLAVCSNKRAEVVPFLIDCGHSLNLIDKKGNTPLHLAVASELPHVAYVVNILAASGADLDLVNCRGQRPLDVCSTTLGWTALQNQEPEP